MQFKETFWVWGYSLFKTPMVAFLLPRVDKMNENECAIRIPLSRRCKNPLGSMYFGALAVGGDLAGSLIAYFIVGKRKLPVSIVFKEAKMKFIRRAESDVTFVCQDGAKISSLLDKTMASGERVEDSVKVEAFTFEGTTPTLVTEFELTLSLKKKG